MEADFKYDDEDVETSKVTRLDAVENTPKFKIASAGVNIGNKTYNNHHQRWERTLTVLGPKRRTELVTSIETDFGWGYHVFHVGRGMERTIDATYLKTIRVDIVEDRWVRKNTDSPNLKHPIYEWGKGDRRVAGVANKQSWPIVVRVSYDDRQEQGHPWFSDLFVLPGRREAFAPLSQIKNGTLSFEGFIETKICVR